MSKPTGILAPNDPGAWTRREATHLLWRAQFGASAPEIGRAHKEGLPRTLDRLLTPQPESEEFRTRCKCRYGYYTATSPDGINWKCNEESALSKECDDPLMSDCNTCNYDPQMKRFIAFTKRHVPRGDGIGDQDVMQRARGGSFSTDTCCPSNSPRV